MYGLVKLSRVYDKKTGGNCHNGVTSQSTAPCSLPPAVKDLVELLFDENAIINSSKFPIYAKNMRTEANLVINLKSLI